MLLLLLYSGIADAVPDDADGVNANGAAATVGSDAAVADNAASPVSSPPLQLQDTGRL